MAISSSSLNTSGKRSIPLSLIGKLIRFISNLIWLTILAWGLLLLMAGIGIVLYGWEWVWTIGQHAIEAMTSNLWAFIPIHISDNTMANLPDWLAWAFPNKEDLSHLFKTGNRFYVTVLLVTQLVVERSKLFMAGSCVILAFAFLGFFDGLIQRDIRKYRAARESTLFFHRCKAFLGFLFYCSYFCFICIPIAFNLSWALFVIAILTSSMVYLLSKYFKKYF